jgi:hypothetical protein
MTAIENCALVLRTSDLTVNSTTQVGICDQYRTNFTWSNINLRSLLGSMYDTYDKFNICLNTIATAQMTSGSIPGTTPDDRIVQIYLSGLPFLNQTYDVVRGGNTPNTVIATFTFPNATGSSTQYFYSSNIATFDKRQDEANIQIFYNRVKTDALANVPPTYIISTGASFPDMIFIFDIFGIPKVDHNYGNRIIM